MKWRRCCWVHCLDSFPGLSSCPPRPGRTHHIHLFLPRRAPKSSAFLCLLRSTSLDGPALSWGWHCSCSPSPGRKSLVIYFLFYTQADVRTANHSQQVRKVIQGFSELLYPQSESFSTPQKPQVSRGQRWPDASCVGLPDLPHGEGQVTCSVKHLVKCFVG